MSRFVMTQQSIAKASVMLMICVLTVTGNSLVVIIGYKNWRHTSQHLTHLLVFNLAIAGVIEALIAMPMEFIEELLGEWLLGDPACRFIEYFQATALGTSVFVITFIAIDRYLSVVRPMTGKLKARHGKYIAFFCWGFPMIISTPYTAIFTVVVQPRSAGSNETVEICEPVGTPYDWFDRLYWTIELYYTFLLPLIVMSFCYTSLVRKVLKMKKVGDPHPLTSGHTDNAAPVIGRFDLTRMKRRSVRLALSFVTLFLLCWSPMFVMQSRRLVYGTRAVTRRSNLYEVALFMAYLNEMLNPVLYALIDAFFRQKLLRLFGKDNSSAMSETATS